ncbi:MAG TPA: PPOX class F420-dependent oxidoreductase [Herpetosiphonaceae bacterium]
MAQTPIAADFAALHGQEFMNLTTFRKNGQPVPTPVWFAHDGDCLYVMTVDNTGKIKRVRNSSRVQVGPSDRRGTPTGPLAEGTARILPSAEARRANALLNQKYGWMKRVFDLFQKIRSTQRVYLEIVPRSDGNRRDRSA